MSVQTHLKNNRIFGVLLLLSELVLIFMFGFFITYTKDHGIADDYFIIAALLILALCGFGLITTYIKPVSIGSIAHLIIIFGLSIQLYFPFRGFWEIIGLSGFKWDARPDANILPVSITNVSNDRQASQMLSSSPLTDYIACFISLVIAYSGVIGRIGNLEVYFLTVFGTFIYEFNSMILWRIFVTDPGYGMRVFLFAGAFGLFASLILGKRQTTVSHPKFVSDYYFQGLNLFAAIVTWCLLPVMVWSDLWHNSSLDSDNKIVHIASLNMWFALCGSAVGAFCGCIIIFKKVDVHTLVFSMFTGGIAFTSSSDVYLNPGPAIGIGVLTGLLCSLLIAKAKTSMNAQGIVDSNGVLVTYLIPGLIAAILSAIFQAVAYKWEYDSTSRQNKDEARTTFEQGGIQIAGLAISLGLGIFVGIISGIFMKLFSNRSTANDQFDPTYIVNENPVKKQEGQSAAFAAQNQRATPQFPI